MSTPTPPAASFWDAVREHARRLLMLDYDGTLAPFRVARDEATIDPEVRASLVAISGSGSTDLVIVSGRTLNALERLLGPLAIHLVGEHGWEERSATGERVLHAAPPAALLALEAAAHAAEADGWADRVERKRCSVVLHTRGLDPDRALALERRCEALWTPAAPGGVTRLVAIAGGRELRALGRDKGSAVADLMASRPPGVLAVYVGDDETDEDAFQVVAPRGFAIRVGEIREGSAAQLSLPSPREVAGFLRDWQANAVGADMR